MTEITVTATMGVMKPLLNKLTELMGDKYSNLKGLRKEVSFLKQELIIINALLEEMDEADELNRIDRIWRKDIIEMSYDIEDYIDDFMLRVGEVENKVGILEKASHYLRTFKDWSRLAYQFSEIKARVLEASKRRRRYKFNGSSSSISSEVIDPRISALYKESIYLVGIDAQKHMLVNWVMGEEKQLKVMFIVGFGGLGKTTLANEVYREVGEQFSCKAFVSISQKPNITILLKSLLSQLGIASHACQVQDLLNKLRGHLQDKRYFVVVDDLWDERDWKNVISCAFPQSNKQSKIVITTRNEDVARACCSDDGSIHRMKPLNEGDSRTLFCNRIFGFEVDCPSQFEEISREILKKCGGVPLAIITLASVLACQPTTLVEQWEYIQNSLATQFARIPTVQDMMYILDLSYKSLPHHLKACFLYLGFYPEDYEIRRVELVRRWVAEGFVSHGPRQDVWDVADRCFNELINRSMIQPTYYNQSMIQPKYEDDENSDISGCRVHDMMLDLIARRCEEDNFLTLVNNPHEVADAQVDKVIRRLTVHLRRGVEGSTLATTTTANAGKNLSRVRSLTIMGEVMWMPAFQELKFLRVLCLSFPFIRKQHGMRVRLDLNNVVNRLLQLRYLAVEGGGGNSIVMPAQISGLRHLETLDFSRIRRGGRNSNILASGILDVPRLCHLLVPEGTRLPDGIGEARSLRTLCGFDLAASSLENIAALGELPALTELDAHCFCNMDGATAAPFLPTATWMAALGACLEKLSNLKLLSVCNYVDGVAYSADGLRHSLSLAPSGGGRKKNSGNSLERLHLYGWTFSVVPRWIAHLRSLRVLYLGAKQVTQEDIDMVGLLPSLLRLGLRIVRPPAEDMIVIRGRGGGGTSSSDAGLFRLPRLFWFSCDCDGMSRLAFGAGAMPELRKLQLALDVDEWDRTSTPQGLQNLASLREIHVRRAKRYGGGWKRRRGAG